MKQMFREQREAIKKINKAQKERMRERLIKIINKGKNEIIEMLKKKIEELKREVKIKEKR